MWLGNRRPVIAPKSNELILMRLEHNKDESKRIPSRPARGLRLYAQNGRKVNYTKAGAA